VRRNLIIALLLVCVFSGVACGQKNSFVTVRDGHLNLAGERIRLWGVCLNTGHLFNHTQMDNTVARIKAMGFNGVRFWASWDTFYEPGKAMTAGWRDYEKGDNSTLDRYDYMVWKFKQAGIFVWCPELKGHMWPQPGDYNILPAKSPEDRKAWGEAIKAMSRYSFARFMYLDERIGALHRYHAKKFLNHVNKYTGIRNAEEPTFAAYELVNESGVVTPLLFSAMDHYVPKRLPKYFHDKYLSIWNAWLKEKYQSDEALKKAWGKLTEGESLAKGTVRARPTFKDHKNYPDARRDDYATFCRGVVTGYFSSLEKFVRAQAPVGVGVNVAPITWDTCTGIGPNSFATVGGGTFNSASTYIKNYGDKVKKEEPLYPYNATVKQHPSLLNAPSIWRIKDKPFMIYETNEFRQGAYHVEHPGILVAYGSWQDWDGVFFHIWGGYSDDWNFERGANIDFLKAPLYYGSWGLAMGTDEILQSQMRAAGAAFRNFLIKPAPNPTVLKVGKQVLNNYYEHLWNFPEHQRVLNTAPLHGLRFDVDADWDGLMKHEGPLAPEKLPQNIRMGKQIQWNRKLGLLKVDTPTVKMAIGFPRSAITFKDGVRLSKTNRKFVCFVLSSEDGKPIAQSAKMTLSVVSRSRNTGYKYVAEKGKQINGTAPVIVDRVACKVTLPSAKGRKCRKIDYALRTIEETDASEAIVLDGVKPVFICEITR